jgi:hypothetical protein
VETAARHQPAPDPGAEGDEHDVVRTPARPRHRLRPRRSAGVVGHDDRSVEGSTDPLAHGDADAGPEVRSRLQAAVGVDQAGQAHTDGGDVRVGAEVVDGGAGRPHDGVDEAVTRRRRGESRRGEDARRLVGVDGDGEHLGAADVDTDGDAHPRQYRRRAPMRPSTSRSALPTQTSTRQPWVSAASTASDTTSSTFSISSPSTGQRGPRAASVPQWQRHPLST